MYARYGTARRARRPPSACGSGSQRSVTSSCAIAIRVDRLSSYPYLRTAHLLSVDNAPASPRFGGLRPRASRRPGAEPLLSPAALANELLHPLVRQPEQLAGVAKPEVQLVDERPRRLPHGLRGGRSLLLGTQAGRAASPARLAGTAG